MTYCTIDEAKREGAAGTNTDVEAAIAAAMERVDRFTGDLFEPVVRTVVARVGGDGRAMLPYRLTTAAVTSVAWEDGAVLEAATYRVYSSATAGEVDAIGVGRNHVSSNILVHGLEPWAHHSSYDGRRVTVTGSFGYSATPPGVRLATAKLAGLLSREFGLADDTAQATGNPQTANTTDPEGNVIPVVPPFNDDAAAVDAMGARTTGYRSVDAMLLPYRRLVGFVGV